MDFSNKKALRKAFWSSLARAVGVLLSVGAGTALRQFIGNDIVVLIGAAILGFLLMWLSEYVAES